ncbi:U3 small nucleolar RNA-associated protein 14 homolog C [Hetaerina americana]|uniref:U3 small nucleolar RNA-associated protein 14 homolog C n=1 Tax=Hetaerina americana TaxID=62018 RepID=UPI003A7F10B5
MEENFSDEELLDTQHSALLRNTAFTYGKKFQRIKPPSRNEPSLEISEFHLVRKGEKKGLVKDLTLSLDKAGKHAIVSQKVKKVQKLIKPLPAPLEKPEAEKIKRTVAFNATKSLLNRWDPIVSANRVVDQLSFPLNVPFFKLRSPNEFLSNPYGKTPLEKEVESILSRLSGKKKEEEKDYNSKKVFFLNRKEIMEQRRELARLRAQQSYKESKARQQNKIKSKKYHRILRRERTKKQLKEFEELMKVDPEAALKKLEELENTRAEERLTLRHRSTGQWARNRAVHAKYDKQSREMLAQQLRLGKELTQKVRVSDSSDGEEDMTEGNELANHENNPWLKKGSDEYQEFITGYRKFWGDQLKNKTEDDTKRFNNENRVPTVINSDFPAGSASEKVDGKESAKFNSVSAALTKFGFIVSDTKEENLVLKRDSSVKRVNCDWECTVLAESMRDNEKRVNKRGKKKVRREVGAEGSAEKPIDRDLDDLFEEMEVSLKSKAQDKISLLKSDINAEPLLEENEKSSGARKEKKNSSRSLQEKKNSQSFMDETTTSLGTHSGNKPSITERPSMNLYSKSNTTVEIDPKKFISIDDNKPLNSGIPSIIETGDDNEDESASMSNCITIAAAFTEDDVVTEFKQEKEAIVEENKPKDIDLTLPGWGEWAGKGVPEVSRRKKKRFIFKVSQHIPRKDDKKESVIINENADVKARTHQVNELPYPYVGVETFEASIRAPIGSTWIPEMAHEKLTIPKVTTLQGAVIEPLTEDALLDESEMKNGYNQDEEFIPEEL